MIMVAGVSVLGLLAGSMASFFGLGTKAAAPATATSPPPPASDTVATELAALRSQVARLTDEVSRLAPAGGGATDQPPPSK
jgi:voltage-gated potassium channel